MAQADVRMAKPNINAPDVMPCRKGVVKMVPRITSPGSPISRPTGRPKIAAKAVNRGTDRANAASNKLGKPA